MVWAYAAEPTISALISFEELVELAIFAENYRFEALHNQAMDMARSKLWKGEWKLQPKILQRVYQALHLITPLREMFCILLAVNQMEVKYGLRNQGEILEWCAAFESSAVLGRDFFLATILRGGADELLNESPCQFHWHVKDEKPCESDSTEENICPFERDACFRDWDKFTLGGSCAKEPKNAATFEWESGKKSKVTVPQPTEQEDVDPPPQYDLGRFGKDRTSFSELTRIRRSVSSRLSCGQPQDVVDSI